MNKDIIKMRKGIDKISKRFLMKNKINRFFIDKFVMPIGKKRKPIKLEWENSYRNSIIPICPHCKEMPYSIEQCQFCGQRFIKEANNE